MSQSSTLYVGLDVHQASMAVAYIAHAHDAEVVYLGTIGTRPCDLATLSRTRPSTRTPLGFVYDAGPCGSWLSRDLSHKGSVCWVMAPSVIPKTAGDRVNTDRRDAIPRARLMRSGELTPVNVPAVEDAAIRDRSRARADVRRDLKAATWRLNAFWRRHDLRSTGRATWGPAHLRWRSAVIGPTPAQPIVFQEDLRAVSAHTERLPRLAQERQDPVNTWRLAPLVDALQALRGVQCTMAVTTVAARGDLTRGDHPRPLMASRGLTPAASSRGERRRQGSLTQAGHTQARRALVAGAWASRDPANVRRHLPLRLEPPPNAIQDIRGKAHVRLCQRDRQRMARGQHADQAVVAMASELVACMGAMATEVPVLLEKVPGVLARSDSTAIPGEETPPRCGATLDRVKKRNALAPRLRQAPDGGQSGGTQSTNISRINRRV